MIELKTPMNQSCLQLNMEQLVICAQKNKDSYYADIY